MSDDGTWCMGRDEETKELAEEEDEEEEEEQDMTNRAGCGVRGPECEDLKTRFALLRHFNMELASLIHMMDLSNVSNAFTMASLLRKMGHCVFSDVKMRLLNNVLSATRVSARYSLRLDLDRGIAFQTKENRIVECLDRNHHTIFAQSFEQLHNQPADAFKRADRAFTVRFRGERGVDVGGPYVVFEREARVPHFQPSLLCSLISSHTFTHNKM